MNYKEGDRVQVQLGPNIEEATVSKVTKNRVTVLCADGNNIEVSADKIVPLEPPEQAAAAAASAPADIAAAFAVPSLDREVDDEEASLYVLSDEWHGQLEAGNPFYEAAEPYMRANPGLVFRYLGAPTVKRHGRRGYEPVIDKRTGLPVEVSGMTLAKIPRHVHEERQRRVAALTDDQDAKRQSVIRDQLEQAGKEAGVGAQMLDAFETARTLRDGLPGKDFQKR